MTAPRRPRRPRPDPLAALVLHRDDCDCADCADGRALGRAMRAVESAPPVAGAALLEFVSRIPADEWDALVRVLIQRPDWGASLTQRFLVLRANLCWLWPNVARVSVSEAAP